MRTFLKEHKHILLFSYFVIYLIWFSFLELNSIPVFYTHCKLDDYIPFCAAFLIPYLLWFPYVGVAMGTTFFHSKSEFYRLCATLYTGMTICLLLYTFFPSGQLLRPDLSGEHGVFATLVKMLYAVDDCTNVCPSIHVYNTLCVHHMFSTWDRTKNVTWIRILSFVLMVLIIASTVFLKQHSVIDGLAAIALWMLINTIVSWIGSRQGRKQFKKQPRRRRGTAYPF